MNRTSQVVIARQGETTTLTLAADFEGDLADFALLIPVPESLDQGSVRVIEPSVVDRLDRYSTPRLVSYTCRNAVTLDHTLLGCGGYYVAGCGAASMDTTLETVPADVDLEAAAGTVTVEAEFQVAEYDVVLLAASGADGLYDWLDLNGFAVPPGGEEILQDYIDAGVHFLAAKVHLEGAKEGVSRLSPLQLRYTSPDWVLPIRIGTISAEAEQEVVIYALTDSGAGDVAISNFPEREVEDECMWPEQEWSSFGAFYQQRLRSAGDPGVVGWITEYSWNLYKLSQDTGYHCDPCTVEKEELYDPGELAELGFTDAPSWTWTNYGGYYDPYDPYDPYGGGGGALLTRLRLVYDPADVTEDLALYTTGMHPENRQIRYIEYDRRLEFLFPVCGEGFVEDPGMCGDELDPSNGRSRAGFPAGAAAAVLIGLAVLGSVTRRRSA